MGAVADIFIELVCKQQGSHKFYQYKLQAIPLKREFCETLCLA